MCVHACMCVHVYVHVHAGMHVHVYAHVCMCVHAGVLVCVFACICACTCEWCVMCTGVYRGQCCEHWKCIAGRRADCFECWCLWSVNWKPTIILLRSFKIKVNLFWLYYSTFFKWTQTTFVMKKIKFASKPRTQNWPEFIFWWISFQPFICTQTSTEYLRSCHKYGSVSWLFTVLLCILSLSLSR